MEDYQPLMHENQVDLEAQPRSRHRSSSSKGDFEGLAMKGMGNSSVADEAVTSLKENINGTPVMNWQVWPGQNSPCWKGKCFMGPGLFAQMPACLF